MLAVEIKHKISNNNPPHNRMEDILTSNVLSLFYYLNQTNILREILSCAINLSGNKLGVGEIDESEVIFWPRCRVHGRIREADALIRIQEKDSTSPIYILIEAKYDSGLSNIGTPLEEDKELSVDNETNEHKFYHQLADEYCCVKCGEWLQNPEEYDDLEEAENNILLYITSHYECPQTDIRECADIIKSHPTCEKKACGGNAGSDIYWLGWRQIYHVIRNELNNFGKFYSTGEYRLINDVSKVLELRELTPFDVFKKLKEVKTYHSIFLNDKSNTFTNPGHYVSFVKD